MITSRRTWLELGTLTALGALAGVAALGRLRPILQGSGTAGDWPSILLALSFLLLGGGVAFIALLLGDTATKVTERKCAQEPVPSDQKRALWESQRRLHLATEAAELGIWSWQPDGDHVVWENARPYAIMGVSMTEPPITAALFAAEFVHPDDLASFERAIASTAQTGSPFAFEGRVRRRDGETRWVAFTGARMPKEPGQPVQVIGTIEDISERKRAVEVLKEVNHRKDRFLAMLAHELRNPLAALRYALELMKRAGTDADLIAKTQATMERQIRHMVRLIDDLLDVSRITQDTLALQQQRVDLASILAQALEASHPHSEHAGHQVLVTLPDDPVYLHADPARLAQVFGNLLINACKYTAPGGRIYLTAKRQGSEVEVVVRDNGIGISSEMQSRVFDMFTQVDGESKRTGGGLGIGLSLVKRLVEMHDGTVTVHSEGICCGSEFVVHLPILDAEPKHQRLAERASESAPARRILVVEDNQDSAESLQLLLDMMGNETEVAHDGVEAIEKAASFKPEVILLDIGLPRMNGYEACRAIRDQPWGKNMVVVALTGWGQEEDRRKSRDAGFDAHMVKPVDHNDLMDVLAGLAPPVGLPS